MSQAAQEMQRLADEMKGKEESPVTKKPRKRTETSKEKKAPRVKKQTNGAKKDHRLFIATIAGLKVIDRGLRLLKSGGEVDGDEKKEIEKLLTRITERLD
jgi:hypothetical protein